MSTPPNSPVTLFSGGIPVAPADLNFGNTVTQQQLNALSSFSQLVNGIPSPGDVWVPTGSMTWDIYSLVLTMAEFALGVQEAPPPPASYTTQTSFVADSNSTVPVRKVSLSGTNLAGVLGTLNESVSPQLERIGFQFAPAETPAAHAPAELRQTLSALAAGPQTAPGPATNTGEVSAPDASAGASDALDLQTPSLATVFLQLQANFNIDKMTDTHGAAFYPTPLYPPDFYQPQYDGSWKSFTVTPGQDDPWAPVANGGQVSGQMVTIPLQRAWWSTWVFASRGWQFSPSIGFGPLSDGGTPPTGMMPMYASAVIFVRNLKVVSAAGEPVPTPAQPFQVNTPQALTPQAAPALQTSTGSDSMLIIGFVCTPLPKCPNPDPSLNW